MSRTSNVMPATSATPKKIVVGVDGSDAGKSAVEWTARMAKTLHSQVVAVYALDLPVALGILGAMGAVRNLDQYLSTGELSLDGAIRPVRGALSIAVCARNNGIANLIVPAANAAEAAVVEGVKVYGVTYLAEVVALINRPEEFSPVAPAAIDHHRRSGGQRTSRFGLQKGCRFDHYYCRY